MQLIPETQVRFGVTRPFDAQQNIRGAMIYLKWLEKQFGPDWVRISAAYNAGEQAVIRHGGVPPYQRPRSMCSGCSTTRDRTRPRAPGSPADPTAFQGQLMNPIEPELRKS